MPDPDDEKDEEPEDLEEKIEELVDDQKPPETTVEMGFDEFQERVSKMWDSLFTPVQKKVAEPAAKKEDPKPEPKKKETTHAKPKPKAENKKDKRRIRLFVR